MKWLVSLIVGFLFAYLVLRLLKQTVGFPAGWPIFIIAAAAMVGLSLYFDRRRQD
jgi:FtsH-binding integral membrane protein